MIWITLVKPTELGLNVQIKSNFRKPEKAIFLHTRICDMRKLHQLNICSKISQVAISNFMAIHKQKVFPISFLMPLIYTSI